MNFLLFFKARKLPCNEFFVVFFFQARNLPYASKYKISFLGNAISAGDIASNIATETRKVHMITRRGIWCLTRFTDEKVPGDSAMAIDELKEPPHVVSKTISGSIMHINIHFLFPFPIKVSHSLS